MMLYKACKVSKTLLRTNFIDIMVIVILILYNFTITSCKFIESASSIIRSHFPLFEYWKNVKDEGSTCVVEIQEENII